MSKKKIIIAVAVAAVIVAGIVMLKMSNDKKKDAALPVTYESAKVDTIITTVSAKGEVSLLDVESIYPNIMAEVEEVYVEKNDVVKKGDPLIRYKLKSKEKIERQLKDAELNLSSAQLALASSRLPVTASERESAKLAVTSAEQSIKDIQASIEQTDSDITLQQQNVDYARQQFDNTNTLYASGIVSKNELDVAGNDLRAKENALAALENQKKQKQDSLVSARETLNYNNIKYNEILNKQSDARLQNSIADQEIFVEKNSLLVEELRKDLADFQEILYSPIDGTVTGLFVSKGEVPSTEKLLMELANVDNYVIKIDVNERNASKIKLGQKAEIEGPVLGQNIVEGRITKIGTIADVKQTNSGTERVVSVEIEVEQNEYSDLLKPGFSLEAVITTGTYENVVVIPILSTVPDSEGNVHVFVIKDDNTLEKRNVTLGVFSGMIVEVTGISEGEKIVAQPTMDMTDGMKVTIENEEEPTADGAAESTDGDKK